MRRLYLWMIGGFIVCKYSMPRACTRTHNVNARTAGMIRGERQINAVPLPRILRI